MIQGVVKGCSSILSVGCLNVRSLCNKTSRVLELLNDQKIDICCITETWLKQNDSAIFAEIHDHKFDIINAPRKGRGGGVALIFNPTKVKPVKNNVKKFKSFEVMECILKGIDNIIRFCVIYRSTQKSSKKEPEKYEETKFNSFIDEFENYLDEVINKSGVPILCGDFNFHVNVNNDNHAQKFISLTESKGFHQHIKESTHMSGNTLDLVLSLKSAADSIPLVNINVENDICVSDHYLVHFKLPFKYISSCQPTREVKEYRELQKIDINQFRLDLEESVLCTDNFTSLNVAVHSYNNVLQCLLDKHAPLISKTFIANRSPWWNETCQLARRERRRAKRIYKKHKSEESKCIYNEKCIDAAIIIDRARNNYYDKKLKSLEKDPKGTYKVINHLLDKEYGTENLPNGVSNDEIANNLKDFFDSKVKNIYSGIIDALPDNSDQAKEELINAKDKLVDTQSSIVRFEEVYESEFLEIVHSMANKSCSIDIIPMWLFKFCISELKKIVLFIVNESLSTGIFPESLKSAIIRPSLKKPGLDPDQLKNYRPISNLSFISKIIEKCAHKQLTNYIERNDLFTEFQSGYRAVHSCETAVTKIHNDLLIMMDKRSHVVLLLLDLSAAFDTINHKLLLQKLKIMYGIQGSVLAWLSSYLCDRSFTVNVKRSKSSSCILVIGVPQGSILGPLLFILYTKDLENIAKKYGFSIHLYADDTQLYFSFDVHSDNPDFVSIKKCFEEIRNWMNQNFLKLNEDKTELLDIGYYQSPLKLLSLNNSVTIEPVLKAKNLGFYFDHRMSLDDEITATQQACNIQLRNLRKIAGRLSFDLKVQLVHSCVLSHLDYCNAAYGSLSEANIYKLQKLQNSAVRFIFSLNGKKSWESITPYTKKLHFLPVRFRIMYKAALLVFKCLNDMAPKYLSKLISTRDTNSHNLRKDNDFFLLSQPPTPNFKITHGAFSHYGPYIWNSLPFSLRCLNNINSFKTQLKTYYFNMAYN